MKKENYVSITNPLPPEDLAKMQEQSDDGMFRVKVEIPTYEVFGSRKFRNMFYRKFAQPGSPLSGVLFQMKRCKHDRNFVDFWIRGRIVDRMKYKVRYKAYDGHRIVEDTTADFESDALDEQSLRNEFTAKLKEKKNIRKVDILSLDEAV